MIIYLVRHGQSIGNEKQLVFGHTDYELTPVGVDQAKEVAEKLKDVHVSICFTSDLIRAYETAKIITNNSKTFITVLSGLREQYVGTFENASYDDIMEKYSIPFKAMLDDWVLNPPVDGESFDVMHKRIKSCLNKIIDNGVDGIIVAHNGTLSMILIELLGLRHSDVTSFYFEHGTYSMVEIQAGRTRLRYFNK